MIIMFLGGDVFVHRQMTMSVQSVYKIAYAGRPRNLLDNSGVYAVKNLNRTKRVTCKTRNLLCINPGNAGPRSRFHSEVILLIESRSAKTHHSSIFDSYPCS